MDERQLSQGIESLIRRLDIQNEILSKREPLLLKNMNFAQQLTSLKQKSQAGYTMIKIPMDVAESNKPYAITGQLFYVLRIVNSSGTDVSGTLKLKFFRNDQQYEIPLVAGQGVLTPFDKAWITFDATAGAIAEVLISEDDDLFKIIDNRLSTSISSIGSITSITGDIAGVNDLPSGATQVEASGVSNEAGADTTTMHTVTAAKTLKITAVQVTGHCSTAEHSSVQVVTTTSGDVIEEILAVCLLGATANAAGNSVSIPFMPPLEVAAGKKIKLVKYSASTLDTSPYARGVVFGYEVTA